MTRHKRNLAIVGGVISSILISPILAAFAVGEFGILMFNFFYSLNYLCPSLSCFILHAAAVIYFVDGELVIHVVIL